MKFRRLLYQVMWATVRWPLMLLLGAMGQVGAAGILAQRVAIYIRWSTDDQSQGTTLDVQRDACRHYALSQGWPVTDDHIYIDDGYSGGNLDRPQIERLREAVRRKDISCVVVYKIDRLSRNIVDATSLVLREWDGVCHLKCVMEPIDTTTELGRVIFSILATFADFERTQIRTRMSAGRLRRASEGKALSTPPYGYDRKDKVLSIVDAEAVVVRRIFEWYTSGLGITAIMKRLSQDGSRTRDGYVWGRSSVERLLKNPAYAGRHVFGRKRMGLKGEARQVFRDAPLVDMEGIVPAIVDPELWQKVQQTALQRRNREYGNGRAISSKHLLTGIARCRCGAPFVAKMDHTGKWYYVCTKRRDTGTCTCSWIPRDLAHDIVLEQILSLRDDAARKKMEERVQELSAIAAGNARAEHTEAEATLKRLESEAGRLDRDYRSGELSAARYNHLLSGMEADITEAAVRAGALAKEVTLAAERVQTQSDLMRLLAEMEHWGKLEIHQQKEMLRSLITSLTMFRDIANSSVSIKVAVHKIALSSIVEIGSDSHQIT